VKYGFQECPGPGGFEPATNYRADGSVALVLVSSPVKIAPNVCSLEWFGGNMFEAQWPDYFIDEFERVIGFRRFARQDIKPIERICSIHASKDIARFFDVSDARVFIHQAKIN